MVTKAIVESIDNIYSIKVRIPILDSGPEFTDATSYNNLSEAVVCLPPRASYIPQVGDVVFVAFEDNDKGKPIIIGCLFKESGNTSQINMEVNDLIVNSKTTLNSNISIGDITYKEISYLEGLKQNIQSTFNNIDKRLEKLEDSVNV